MVRAKNPGLVLEQTHDAVVVDVHADGYVDSRKNVVYKVDILVLVNCPENNNIIIFVRTHFLKVTMFAMK